MDTSFDSVLHELKRLLSERLSESEAQSVIATELDEEAPLFDLGVDSIDLVVVLTYFEQELGLSFDNEEVDVERYPTLTALAASISGRTP